MAGKPSKQTESAPAPVDHSESPHDRPTLNPPFDVAAYARATTSPAEYGEQAWSEREVDAFAGSESDTEPRAARITATNEEELESARARSAQSSSPPDRLSVGALSIADARATYPPRRSSPGIGRSEEASRHDLPTPADPSRRASARADADGASAAPEITERTIEDPVAEMRDRFALGDYTGALEIAELILAEDPRHLEAAECGENCRLVLEKMYMARLGPLDRIPTVIVPRTQLRWLSIDHRAGFVLSLVDGSSSVDMILDVSGMARLDALRILHELVLKHIVAIR